MSDVKSKGVYERTNECKKREMLGWMTKGRLNHWCYIFNKPFEFLFLSL